jgi:HD-GYP domain-containing protein (c-di-GMP phosphodiesterase class II)
MPRGETGEIAKGDYAVALVGRAGGEMPMRCVIAAMPWSVSSPGRWIVIFAPSSAHPSRGSGDDGLARVLTAQAPPARPARDPATDRHAGRVADLVERMATSLGWSDPRIAKLRQATLLHDVGKIGVPDTLLLHPGPLHDAEYERVKRHATLGANILAEVIGPEQTSWVRHHHEHYDGRGYPDGLIGDHIPEGAALIAVADTFDVIVSGRPYAVARGGGDALAEIRSLSGIQFSPRAVAGLEGALATA